MTNITLSAPKELIEAARKSAGSRGTTLNQEFRDWLAAQAAAEREKQAALIEQSFVSTAYFRTARKYTREEMNER